MKIKTNELIDLALDWAVSWCEGRCTDMLPIDDDQPYGESFWVLEGNTDHMYSTRWNAGGPILDREGIWTRTIDEGEDDPSCKWRAVLPYRTVEVGPTPLIAAMRCYVASKLGDDVEIPAELLTE